MLNCTHTHTHTQSVLSWPEAALLGMKQNFLFWPLLLHSSFEEMQKGKKTRGHSVTGVTIPRPVCPHAGFSTSPASVSPPVKRGRAPREQWWPPSTVATLSPRKFRPSSPWVLAQQKARRRCLGSPPSGHWFRSRGRPPGDLLTSHRATCRYRYPRW